MSKSSTRRGKVIDLRKWHGGLRASAQTRAVPAPRPKMPLRARRMRVRALLALVFAAAAAASVWGVSALSYSPKLAINSIAVLGVKEVPVPLVRAYVETKLYDGANPLLSRGSIFLYPRTKIEKGIPGYFPRISTADVSRAGLLAQALTVTIEERYPFALWCSGAALPSASLDDCYLMDGGGFVFAPATTSPANSYLIFGGGLSASTSPIGRKFLPAHLSGVLELDKLLRQAGFAKAEIREASQAMGLPTWDKPAAACLASRFPYGATITAAKLSQVDQAEDVLRKAGFRMVRVRHHGDLARIETGIEEMGQFLDADIRRQVSEGLKAVGYTFVALDLQGYRTGAMNETLKHS